MTPRTKIPPWAAALLTVFAVTFAIVYVQAIRSGVDHGLAIRTYVFWALVTAPVAGVVDLVRRTVLEYRYVQMLRKRLVPARVRRS